MHPVSHYRVYRGRPGGAFTVFSLIARVRQDEIRSGL